MMATAGSNGRNGGTGWLPLGSAQLVDWKLLGGRTSPRGAMAWAAAVHGESVIVRSWHDESTAYYEFYFLAYQDLAGTLAVSTTRPETNRLRLEIAIQVADRLAVRDINEFHEHPQTGLYGATTRTVEISRGDLAAELLGTLGAAEAEIFEYAPETALSTTCGHWIQGVLEAVRAQILDGEAEAGAESEPVVTSARPAGVKRERPTIDAPSIAPEPAFDKPKTKPEEPPRPKKPQRQPIDRLMATTADGDSWELDGDEIFIGRSKQCGVVLKSQRVSRKHASVTREDDGFYINDLGAANGIWVGTEKIDRERIEDGAEYIIGDILVTFHYP